MKNNETLELQNQQPPANYLDMVKSGCIAVLEASNLLENLNNGGDSMVIRRTSSVDMSLRVKSELLNVKDNFLEKPSFDQFQGVIDDVNILHVVITS